MLDIAILGGSGYTGNELLRLLLSHPHVKVKAVTSQQYAGKPVSDTFLNFRNTALTFEPLNLKAVSKKADLFFLCLPHKASQDAVAYLHNAGKKVIDLSADFRLKSAAIYNKWYGTPHRYIPLLRKAVYGLPEIYRNKIRKASLIANPGCYPTGAILGLAPLMGENFADKDSVIIDSKSGTSGAGRGPAQPFMFCEVNESVKAYGVTSHRHTPEIEQELSMLAGNKLKVIFTPHLMPIDRGILSTLYVRLKDRVNRAAVQKLYNDFYCNEPFVRVMKNGVCPATKDVRGSNFCDISVFLDTRSSSSRTIIVVSAIDNLTKGASGTAVQNMNIIYGFDETSGLVSPPPLP